MSDGPGQKKRRYLSLIVRCTVAAGALAWVFAGQDWGDLAKVFGRLDLGYFLLSLAAFALGQFLVALRWRLLLRAQEIRIEFWATVRLHFLGLFYNNFMPGSVGGDLLRMWYVTKHTDKKLGAAISVFVDRVIGLVGMAVIAAVCYGVFMRGQGVFEVSQAEEGAAATLGKYKTGALCVLGALAACFVILVALKPGRKLMRRGWEVFVRHARHLIREVIAAVVIYCKSPLTVLGAVSLTILLQVMVIASFWVLGINLQVGAAAKYYFVFFPLVWVLGAIPVSIAGIGILEGGLVMLFTQFAGAASEEILALAICQRFVWIIASLPGAAIHVFGGHLPKEFFIDEKPVPD